VVGIKAWIGTVLSHSNKHYIESVVSVYVNALFQRKETKDEVGERAGDFTWARTGDHQCVRLI